MSGSNTELRGAVETLPVLIAAHPMCFIIEGTGHAVSHIEYQGNRKEGCSGVHVQCAAGGINCFAQLKFPSKQCCSVCCTGFLIMGTKNRLNSLRVAGCGGHGLCLDGNTKQCSHNVITDCSVQDNVSYAMTC